MSGSEQSGDEVVHGPYQTDLEKKAEALEGYSCKNCGIPVEPDKATRCGVDYYCGPECYEDDRHPVESDDDRASVNHRSLHTDADQEVA